MHGLVQEIAALIAGTCMVRVFDASGYRPPPPARKRRDRVTPLAEVRDALAVRELREALALRPDTPVMDWMSGTDVILELWNRDGAQHATIGLLSPDQLRHDDGELRLLDPGKAARWLALGAEYRGGMASPAATAMTAGPATGSKILQRSASPSWLPNPFSVLP